MGRSKSTMITAEMSVSPENVPLCVDLDGTLVRTDTLMESVLLLIKLQPWAVLLMPFWLLRGRAAFKQRIAEQVSVEPETLPYNDSFLEFLRGEHSAGRCLVLATGSNSSIANAVARDLGIFQRVMGSTTDANLSGQRKAEALVAEFGSRGFDYAGNALRDVPVFAESRNAILVNPAPGLGSRTRRGDAEVRIFDDRSQSVPARYLSAIRVHQWLKNVVVFGPLILAHRISEPNMIAAALLAFVSFCLCASSVYLLNDLLDLSDDRRHPTKRERALASGRVSLLGAAVLAVVLLALAFGLALTLPVEFIGVLAFYYLVTLLYSFRFKSSAPSDVLILAGLYTLRIIAGASAVSVEPSFWLLAFSMFLFLSLALAKRYTGLKRLAMGGDAEGGDRGYRVADLELLSQFGISSAFAAVTVLALYINSDAIRELYGRPEMIWLLCPLLLYIVSRLWLLARRGELDEDPVVFAMRDIRTHAAVAAGLVLLWLAT